MKRLLVIRGGAIGDFVLTLPTLGALRDAFPTARIEILGYKHIVALADGRHYADAVRSIEYSALAGFFARGAELSPELADYFRSFDLVISYLFDPDRRFEQNLRRCGVDEFLPAPAKVLEGGESAARQLAAPLADLGLELEQPAAMIHLSLGDRTAAEEFLRGLERPIVALHPGSGSERKNWPLARWLELRACLQGNGVSLLIVGGEADAAQLQQMRSRPNETQIRTAENLPLPHLAAALAECNLFIGHDSGISHIAAATGTPCVLLFGPTDPEVWAPAHSSVTILRSPDGTLGDIGVEEVWQAATQARGREILRRTLPPSEYEQKATEIRPPTN